MAELTSSKWIRVGTFRIYIFKCLCSLNIFSINGMFLCLCYQTGIRPKQHVNSELIGQWVASIKIKMSKIWPCIGWLYIGRDKFLWSWEFWCQTLLDCSLKIGWMKWSQNPERVFSVFTFVPVSLCLSVYLYGGYWGNLSSRKLLFYLKWIHGILERNTIILFSLNLLFLPILWKMFPLYNTSKWLFTSY